MWIGDLHVERFSGDEYVVQAISYLRSILGFISYNSVTFKSTRHIVVILSWPSHHNQILNSMPYFPNSSFHVSHPWYMEGFPLDGFHFSSQFLRPVVLSSWFLALEAMTLL